MIYSYVQFHNKSSSTCSFSIVSSSKFQRIIIETLRYSGHYKKEEKTRFYEINIWHSLKHVTKTYSYIQSHNKNRPTYFFSIISSSKFQRIIVQQLRYSGHYKKEEKTRFYEINT
jgi:RNase P/RNase MRP subunit POP5